MWYNNKQERNVIKMKKSGMIIIGVIVVIAVVLIAMYNGLVGKREAVDNSMANLDVMLQRRADLIPNLVNTVKGYMQHETEIIDKITTARQNLVGASSVTEKAEANQQLSTALNGLMVIVENYPDLKSSENFIQLSDELAGTENRIATARRDYNEAVKGYNASIKKFPNNILSGMFGFEQVSYFEATEGSQEVPNVSFE